MQPESMSPLFWTLFMQTKYIWLGTLLLSIVLIVFGAQIFIGATSKGADPKAQDSFRELTQSWARSRNTTLRPEDIGSPVGKTSLGCRLWALDFFRGNCFGIFIYVDSSPDASFVESLKKVLAHPCKSASSFAAEGAAQKLQLNLGCDVNRGGRFRVVVAFQKVHAKYSESGHVSRRFTTLNLVEIEGKF